MTDQIYTDTEIIEILNLKAATLTKEVDFAQQKADSLHKEAKVAQTEADKLKQRLKIMVQSAENIKNTIEITIEIKKIQEKEPIYKVLMVGEIGTGKTSIIKRTVHDIFTPHYKQTIGVDFALKVIDFDDITYRFQLWDIAGQERFGNMTHTYYREAMAAFVVFDVTRLSTLDGAIKWKNDIDSKVALPMSDNPIPVILLANKVDLIDREEWKEISDKLDEICKKHGFICWYKVSAKNNINIELATNVIFSKIIEIDS